MNARQRIEAELDKIPEDRLDELYGIIREFAATTSACDGPGIMTKLQAVRIEAPPDFALKMVQPARR